MSDLREIAPDVHVCPQVSPQQLAALQAQGIRAVVCNRPDGEEAGQPAFATIAAEAERLGIEVRYLPVHHGGNDPDLPSQAARLLGELPRPMLAYCRSGARSAQLFGQALNAV